MPNVVILCGGRGTRLVQESASIPKPLVEIGGRPILWHVIQIYLAQRFERFLLLTGYKGEQIERFVTAASWPAAAQIQCLATGEDMPTGGRLALAADSVLEREPLQRLAATGELRACRHEGVWDCMDTYKDAVVLNDLWASGSPPWKLWH
jgi:NDP-sugar pyrophosphorylase family protein